MATSKGMKFPNRKRPSAFTDEHKNHLKEARKRMVYTQERNNKIRLAKLGKKRPEVSGERNYGWKGGLPKCKDCGAQLAAYGAIFCKYHAFKGERAPAWRGGKTTLNQIVRCSTRMQNWRKSVFERDNFTCQDCGARSMQGLGRTVKLNADHIKPFSLFPELRFELLNGRTLCVDCHKKTDTYAGKIKTYVH